jgi:predicted nucleic acid-binding protein
MFALDTNLLVYAHNTASTFHPQAKAFVEKAMNERDSEGKLSICIPAQVLMEFLNVITRHQLESPLSLHNATQLVQDYIDTGVVILYPTSTQLTTLLDLLKSVNLRTTCVADAGHGHHVDGESDCGEDCPPRWGGTLVPRILEEWRRNHPVEPDRGSPLAGIDNCVLCCFAVKCNYVALHRTQKSTIHGRKKNHAHYRRSSRPLYERAPVEPGPDHLCLHHPHTGTEGLRQRPRRGDSSLS